jgi:choline monooxygenase
MAAELASILTHLTAEEIAAVRAPLPSASFIPPRLYSDPAVFELEQRTVFRRSWLPLCHVSQIAEPSSFHARVLFGEAVVATRDRDGAIHVLTNVCRHRNAVVAQGSGACRGNRLTCPYHGWSYALDGRLLAAPHMELTADFDKSRHRLPTLRHEVWQGFVFVNFDANARPLAPQLATLLPKIAPYKLESMQAVPVRRAAAPWNWKVSLENFTEGYHQPGVHPITADQDFPSLRIVYEDSDGPYSYFRLPHGAGEKTHTVVPAAPDMPDAYYREFAVFNVYPLLHLFTDSATPLWLDWEIRGVDDHDLIWYMLVPKQHLNDNNLEQVRRDFLGFVEPILLEDVAVCKAVGEGVRSTLAASGRLSWMEKSVHQFQNWLLDQYQSE